MQLYKLLDLAVTMTEGLVLYVITLCFCRTPRFHRWISAAALPVIYMSTVIGITWFTDWGAERMFIMVALTVALIMAFYSVSICESLVTMEVFWMLLAFPESVATALASLAFNGEIMTVVEGIQILKWQLYVLTIVIRCLALGIAYLLLHDFHYRIRLKDAVVLTAGFLPGCGLGFAGTYGYLNLGMEDTFVLDLATSAFYLYFALQFLYSKNMSYLREQRQRDKIQIDCLERQFSWYQEKLRDEERVRGIYHDLKNHLLLLESGSDTEQTRRMAEKLRAQIEGYEDYVHSGNAFLDIILKDKAAKARERQIDFSVRADMEGIDFIEPLDISTIFGNAIDNALEACGKLPEEKRFITVKAGRVRDMLIITIENSAPAGKLSTEKTTKADSFIHGFGLPNIRNAVHRSDGQCDIKAENGVFTLRLLIPIQENSTIG